MSWKTTIQNFGFAGLLIASISISLVQPVFAADKVIIDPAATTVNEGGSLEVDVSIPEPIISEEAESGYVFVGFESNTPSRLSIQNSGSYFESEEWSIHNTMTLLANEDPFVNQDEVVTISYSIQSTSEFYNEATGSFSVTVKNNDITPVAAITYPKANQSLPAGSLTITGTATPNSEIGVKIDGNYSGTTKSDTSGKWELLIEKIKAGQHNIVAQIQTSDHYAFMANAYSESIDVVNMDTHEYVYEITETGSVGATYNLRDNTVYSASTLDGVCHIIAYDPLTYQEKFRITDESNQENCTAISMTISPNGKTGYLLFEDTDYDGYNGVMVVNLANRSFQSSTVLHELYGNYPSGIAISPDASRLWVRTDSSIERFSTTGYIYLGSIELNETGGSYRQNIVFNKEGTRAYTADVEAGLVHVIDTATNEVVDTITADEGVNMIALSPDESKLFIAAAYPTSAIFVASTATNELIDTETVPSNLPPESVAINQDGQWVVGDDHGSGAIFFGDVDNNATVASTIYAPRGGSYYTSTSNFASPVLFNVLGVSTSVDVDAVAYAAPKTGLAPNSNN